MSKVKSTFHKHLWGHEEWLVNNELYCAKYLVCKKGVMSSLHYHKNKDETFRVIKGEVLLEIGQGIKERCGRITLKVGDGYRLKPGTIHRFRSIANQSVILEVSTHHEDADSIKIKVARELDKDVDKGYTIAKEKK